MLKSSKFLYIVSCLTLSYPALAQIETRDDKMPKNLFPWQSPNQWAPLSQAEIDGAHTCTVGAFLAVCAGDKIIATGIMINSTNGTSLKGPADQHFGKSVDFNKSVFSVDAMATIHQLVNNELNTTDWKRNYYILNDEQLINVIEMARRDPTWNPVK